MDPRFLPSILLYASRHGIETSEFYFSLFFPSVASASKSHVIYKPLVVVNQKPLLLARSRCWRKLWEKVLPALPRGHAQFKRGTDCLSSQHCIVNTFFSFLLKLQRVWGLLLYFLTGFFILWSGQKRKCLNKSDVLHSLWPRGHKYMDIVCLRVLPLAWSLSRVLTPFFHSSICSWRGLIRPSKKIL